MKKINDLQYLSIFVLSLFLGWSVLLCESLAAVSSSQDSHYNQGPKLPAGGEEIREAKSAPLWHLFLWETLPAEWIRNPKQSVIFEAYQLHGWRPFFVDPRFELTEAALALIKELDGLDREAIDPGPYRLHQLRERLASLDRQRIIVRSMDPELRYNVVGLSQPQMTTLSDASHASSRTPAANPSTRSVPDLILRKEIEQQYRSLFHTASIVDVHLTENLVRYAHEMNPFSRPMQLKVLLGELSFADFLRDLEPPTPRYAALRSARSRYRLLASNAEQKQLNNPTLRLGDKGAHVRRLQERLAQEGFYAGNAHGTFDAETRRAVEYFQTSHLLEADGAVGPRTTAWLNVSYSEKTALIEESMKVLRQSRMRLYDRYVWINIPQFMLEYHRDGGVQALHRVIVGKAAGKRIRTQSEWIGENHTPTLSSRIEQVILNPRWYVSDRIRLELNSEMAADPNYFARHGYVEMSSKHPWGQPRVFQRPGPTNPLGQVKFEFPNAHAVYLHDTPNKHFFKRTRRDMSHGCIRLDKALEFARLVLTEDANPAAEKLQEHIASNRQLFIKLQEPLPIIIDYMPVSCDENGQIVFCGDPYERLKAEPDKKKAAT